MKVWILYYYWIRYDESGFGIIGVYASEELAMRGYVATLNDKKYTGGYLGISESDLNIEEWEIVTK